MNKIRPARPERQLHVCFICNELPPARSGGIGPCVATNAVKLAELGCRVSVIGVYSALHDWQYDGVDVHPVILQRGKAPLYKRAVRLARERLLIRSAILRLHRQHPIDIVEWPDYEGLFVRPIPGIVDVVRNHGPFMSHRLHGLAPRRFHIEWLECRTLRSIPNWIGVSEWFLREWLRLSGARPQRTEVLYNPVDCQLFAPPARGERKPNVILYAGSLMERKGAFALARAARHFLPELPGVTLLFLGKEPLPQSRQRLLDEAGAEAAAQIRFRDPVPQRELAQIMRESTLFVMPSILESFGNVWAEAMASALPVVGSTLTCGPEIVPAGRAGLLADPSSPQDIASAVLQLMRNAALRERMGIAGRAHALAHYATNVVIPRTAGFYKECLAAGARPPRDKKSVTARAL